MKDSIDFGSMDVSMLFRKLLVPTVLGMVFSAIFVITDGIFVGKGIGSDALAAVNIAAPFFMIATGIGLMFGIGGSVVASIHLSQRKSKAASINITQALIFSWIIRLDGSPNYAMMCNAVAAILNIILDYIFIFEFGWGMMGAAFATSLGTIAGGLMTLIYLLRFSHNIRLYRIKLSVKSLMLTFRNVSYMIKLGTSGFVSEASIACMMFLGNYVFIHHLGEDGVAAFSIACYFFPIIFMVYNAIAQSAQPIISYNFGAGQPDRVRKALHLAIRTALICGISFFIITFLCRQNIVSLFIDRSCPAFDIAVNGIPYFGVGFIFFAANMIGIGYYQSIRRGQRATIITLLRGVVFMLIGFFVLPLVLGVPGIWLAVSLAELLTTLYIIGIYFKDRFMVHRL